MREQVKVTVSARVSPRTRRLGETAAELSGLTLSRFVEVAVSRAAHSELLAEASNERQQQ